MFLCFFVSKFQRKIDGYKFPVYSTALCPRNETEWNERSSALNCTESNGYTCLPNQNFTELLEFCYTEPLIWIQKGIYSFLYLTNCALHFFIRFFFNATPTYVFSFVTAISNVRTRYYCYILRKMLLHSYMQLFQRL